MYNKADKRPWNCLQIDLIYVPFTYTYELLSCWGAAGDDFITMILG